METPIEPSQPNSGSNRNIIIAVVVVVILCCCCVFAAVAGYYGYKAYAAAQTTIDQIQNIEIPTDVPFDPNSSATPSDASPDSILTGAPLGGLTDDSTRIVAWSTVQIAAAIQGCSSPQADSTTIVVTQQPDSKGVWIEEWTVDCGDGTTKPVDLTFTPENGTVSVGVEFK